MELPLPEEPKVHFAGVGLGVGDDPSRSCRAGRGWPPAGWAHGHAGQRCEVLHGVEGIFLYRLALMAWVPTVPMNRVWPSGVALAAAWPPMLPPAPARLSTDGLAQLSRQRLADDAGQDVGGAACGEGHDDGDGLGGVSLGQGRRTAEQTSAQNDGRSRWNPGRSGGWRGNVAWRSPSKKLVDKNSVW